MAEGYLIPWDPAPGCLVMEELLPGCPKLIIVRQNSFPMIIDTCLQPQFQVPIRSLSPLHPGQDGSESCFNDVEKQRGRPVGEKSWVLKKVLELGLGLVEYNVDCEV